MIKNYKLNEEIKEFIISQKKGDPRLSCRALTSLIKEHFQLNISKSLINNVIKEHNLSSPVGRRRVREAKAVKLVAEIKAAKKEADFMENGGFFFLKAADLKLGLTGHLAEILSSYCQGLSTDAHRGIIESLIYSPYFTDKKNLYVFIGVEVSEETLKQYSNQLILAPFPEVRESVKKLGIDYKPNEINSLWKESLLRLNAYIVHFFPPEYQFLDFLAMQERFYCLPGKVERRKGLMAIQLFYPPQRFQWFNDVIWQEGFFSAASKVNDAKIITQENEQIWMSPQVEFR